MSEPKGFNGSVLIIDDLKTDCDPLKIKEFMQIMPKHHEYERTELGNGWYRLKCKRFGTSIICSPRDQDGPLTRAYKECMKENDNA